MRLGVAYHVVMSGVVNGNKHNTNMTGPTPIDRRTRAKRACAHAHTHSHKRVGVLPGCAYLALLLRDACAVYHVDLVTDEQLAGVLGRVLGDLTKPVAHMVKGALVPCEVWD